MPGQLRKHWSVLLALLLLLTGPLVAQEVEVLDGQAGVYPVRAYLSAAPVVGPAHIVVEVGKPTTPDALVDPPELKASLILDMPNMASMKPLEVPLASASAHRFEGDFFITMKGVWRIQFVVSTPHGEFRFLSRVPVGEQPAPPKGKGPNPPLELCAPASGDTIPLQIRCFPDPPRVGLNRLRIELPEKASAPMMVGVTMPGMIVGIPPLQAQQQDDGSYQAVVDLPMAGYWQVVVDLNGRTLPPFALTVAAPSVAGASRGLLFLALLALAPGLIWCLTKRRRSLATFAVCATVILSSLGAGLVIERYWPSESSMGMVMDMGAADMGLSHLRAPVPVMEAKVQKAPLAISRRYAATVAAAKETNIVATSSGTISRLATVGEVVRGGQSLAEIDGRMVKAPFAGVVIRQLRAPGDRAAQGEPILAFSDTKTVTVVADASVSDRDMLQPGLEVDVLDSENRLAKGKITRVSALARGDFLSLEATVDNTAPRSAGHNDSGASVRPSQGPGPGTFFIGQTVFLRCDIQRFPSTLSVPREAVQERSDGSAAVWVIDEVAGQRLAHSRKVGLGPANTTHIQIVEGLREGDIVVASSEPGLRDGDLVSPAHWGEGVYRTLLLPGQADPAHSP